ncbi:ribokinase [Litorimonas taeanensis]|uniref:Ribokinase n=1 Tax=Litorimonas taeanensis TaxID=568099 RepID=A0A420WJN5_9PROT|nr:ribokinase [Litorimonas taeanensis]RKQ71136.1 ribokinase [Litorimonas taeanensis]
MTTPTICVLGSVNLDLIIQTKVLPQAGETVTNGHFTALPGGKGGNVALAAKRLGGDVTLQAAIGDDDYAEQALVFLKQAKVDLSDLVKIEQAHTGLAFINVSDDGENQIAVASGANAAFTAERLNPISADAIFTQFEIPTDTILAALKPYKGFVAINASPVLPGLNRLTDYADLIIVNEGEYRAYEDALSGYEGLLAITLGGVGAKLLQNGNVIAQAAPPKIDVVDTTGAGDAFAAALTLALLEGQSHQKALEFACTVGALTTTKIGTQSAAPSRKEVEAKLAAL